MNIHLQTKGGKPIYQQIVDQVKILIAAGRLEPGQELPPIRALAKQLVINPNTVARAYRDLEQAGLLISKQGAGTCVAQKTNLMPRQERLGLLNGRADALLAEANQLDISLSEVLQLIRERSDFFRPRIEFPLNQEIEEDEFID